MKMLFLEFPSTPLKKVSKQIVSQPPTSLHYPKSEDLNTNKENGAIKKRKWTDKEKQKFLVRIFEFMILN